MDRKLIACIVGARPNFMKMAPLLRAFEAYDVLQPRLIHTGQHYDAALSDVFFEELEMPAISTHTNFQMAAVSLLAAVAELERLHAAAGA